MQQCEFIMMAKKCSAKGSVQDEVGNTTINLRDGINISHNYKKKNQMKIIFIEDQAQFIIPDKNALQEIYAIHMMNKDAMQLIRDYCSKEFQSAE